MEVEAVALGSRGLWLDEGKPAQGYGPHFNLDDIGVSKLSRAMGEMAFEMPLPEKAVTGRGVVKAASWSDLGSYFAYRPEDAWTAPAEVIAAGNKAAPAEVFAAGNKAAPAEVFAAGNMAAPADRVFAAGIEEAPADRVFVARIEEAPADRVFVAGIEEAPADRVFVAGNKAAQVEGREEAKSAVAVKKTKKVVKKVLVSQDRIDYLLAHPPNVTLSERLRAFTKETCPFYEFDPSILDYYPVVADSMDKWNKPQVDILRQFNESGFAYEEIEVDEEIEADEGN